MACSILLIDDDRDVRESMKSVLEIQGYHVVTAVNGLEGVEKLKALDKLPCVILLDLMMPDVNGWQFLDMQSADPKLRDVPVVICSAYMETAKSIRTVDGFIPKPVQLNSLLGAVKAFCA